MSFIAHILPGSALPEAEPAIRVRHGCGLGYGRAPGNQLEFGPAGILKEDGRVRFEILVAFDVAGAHGFQKAFELEHPGELYPKCNPRQTWLVIGSLDEPEEAGRSTGVAAFEVFDRVVTVLAGDLVPFARFVYVPEMFVGQAELGHECVVERFDCRERAHATVDVIEALEPNQAFGLIATAFTASEACASKRLKFSKKSVASFLACASYAALSDHA